MEEIRNVDKKTYLIVADHIRELILQGRLTEGDKLPSERELADKYGFSRATIREALIALEIMGYANVKKGLGTYVVKDYENKNDELDHIIETNSSPSDVFETRLIIEPALARLAAVRAKQEELVALDEMIRKTNLIDNKDLDTFEEHDKDFHMLIAKAAHNTTLYQVSEMINSDRMGKIWGSLKIKSLQVDGRVERYKREHEQLYQAIKNRNPHLAEELASDHLLIIRKHIFEEAL